MSRTGPREAVAFQRGDLVQAPDVLLAAVELRCEEGPDQLRGELPADDPGAEAEHVHVVVLDALVGGVDVVADRGADAVDLARGDRGAGARAADEHGAVGPARAERFADLAGLVRIVHSRLRTVDAEVDGVVPERLQLREHPGPQCHAAMIERDGDPHCDTASSACPPNCCRIAERS